MVMKSHSELFSLLEALEMCLSWFQLSLVWCWQFIMLQLLSYVTYDMKKQGPLEL